MSLHQGCCLLQSSSSQRLCCSTIAAALTGSTDLGLLSLLDELEVLHIIAHGGGESCRAICFAHSSTALNTAALAGLQATLPAEWPDSLPNLQILKLADLSLSGGIPAACAPSSC